MSDEVLKNTEAAEAEKSESKDFIREIVKGYLCTIPGDYRDLEKLAMTLSELVCKLTDPWVFGDSKLATLVGSLSIMAYDKSAYSEDIMRVMTRHGR